MRKSCATWIITFLRDALVSWIRRREGSCWLRDMHIFRRVRLGRVDLRQGSSLFLVHIRWAEGIDRSIRWLAIPPPQNQILWQCWSVNFIWCWSVNFIWCQLLTSCTGGYVISTWFSIVWEPKTQPCGYVECAHANITMVVDAILQTRVPLEIWNNKESF